MKRIYVSLTDEEKTNLDEIAKLHDSTASELLAAFVSDLTYSNRSGGSDEIMYAHDWLGRQTCRWSEGKLL